MNLQAVSYFFAMLSILVVVGIVAIGLESFTSVDLGVVRALRPLSLEGAAAIATTSTLGSLYMSEIANLDPCRLCWIQRGFMYPAAVLLIAAVFVKNRTLAWMAMGLSVGGLGVALYHRYEQFTYDPLAGSDGFCDPTNPCGAAYLDVFGFISIPTMAAAGFAGVITMVLLNLRKAA